MKPEKSPTYIGIDIAKDTLEAEILCALKNFTNNSMGLRSLLKRLKHVDSPHVICEATGGYEKNLMEALWEAEVPVTLANAARVRNFANSEGLKAKTDAIDARMLTRFGQEKRPEPTQAPTAERKALSELLDRRAQLSEALGREKKRLAKSPASTRSSIERVIAVLEEEIKRMDQASKEVVESDKQMHDQDRLFQSVCGIGAVTSWTVLAYLGDISGFKRNQLVALAGVAPFNKDTGKKIGKRTIQGGRAKVRRCLFMAAQTAATHNPVIRAYVQRLCQRGKPYKCALVAAMRKMLIHIHSLSKNKKECLA